MTGMRRWWKHKFEEWHSDVVPYADPLTAGRHPFQVYLLTLALISGITQLIGNQPPDTITESLEPFMVTIWSYMLVGGSLLTLMGSYWPKAHYDTGLTLERIGLAFTGTAACIYGIVIIRTLHLPGAVAGGITIGFGLACLIRTRGIGKIFNRALDPDPPRVETEEESQ